MDKIEGIGEDFVSHEKRSFKFRLGRLLASSLSGFIAGVILTSIFWFVAVYLLKLGL